MVNKTSINSSVLIILCSVYVSFGWLAEVFQIIFFKRVCLVIGICITIVYGKVIYGRISRHIKLLLFLLYVGAAFHNIVYFSSYEGMGDYLYAFFLFPVTIVMSLAFIELAEKKPAIILPVFASAIVMMSAVYYLVFFMKVDPNTILKNSSQNAVGTYLFSSCILYSAAIYIRNKSVDVIVPLFMFILSIYLIGRTVMIVSGVYFFMVLYLWVSKRKSFILRVFLLISAIIVIVYLFQYYIGEDIYSTNIYTKGGDTVRYDIWRIYVHRLDIFSFIFGDSLWRILPEWNGNPHNSYIVMHSNVGVFIILFFLIIFYSLKEYIKDKEYYMLGLTVLLMIRITTDMGYLFTILDYILFVLIIYPFYKGMPNLKGISKKSE